MSRQRIILIGLIASVGLNLFLLAGIGARLSSINNTREARPFPPNIGWIVRDLSAERQAELANVLEPIRDEISPLRQAMFEAQRNVNELMAADEFNQTELEAAFAALRSASEAYTSLSHQQTASVLGELTAEERETALNFVQRRGPRDGRDSMRGPPGPGGPGFRPPDGGQRGPGGNRPPPRPPEELRPNR